MGQRESKEQLQRGSESSPQTAVQVRRQDSSGNHPIAEAPVNANGWGNDTTNLTSGGWGPPASTNSSRKINHGPNNGTNEVQFNGWGETGDKRKALSCRPTSSEVSSNGWMDQPAKEEFSGWGVPSVTKNSDYNGWLLSSRPSTSEIAANGWINERSQAECNGWYMPESKPVTDQNDKYVNMPENINPLASTNSGFSQIVSPVPSAPPVPEEYIDERPMSYPSIDVTPVELSYSSLEHGTAQVANKKEEDPSLCIICWESPVVGACVPCGHMAGCMQCLNEIISKKGNCPVCRAKIDQVIKLYAV